jgi:23S rRNA pseudouridine1911/1915/1917 synthase
MGKGRHRPQGLTIVHEDPAIIVVEKVAGLLTIGTDRERVNTAYFRLTDYVRKGNDRSRNRIFIVHRLDRETSGLLVVAKTWEAKLALQDNWEDVRKRYVAVAHGNFAAREGTYQTYLAENSAHVVYSVSNPNHGKYARTDYRVLRQGNGKAMVELDLLTGRKHQIRVHLAEAGHPIVGDEKYSKRKEPGKRLMLHSTELEFAHPVTKAWMKLSSRVPGVFGAQLGGGA